MFQLFGKFFLEHFSSFYSSRKMTKDKKKDDKCVRDANSKKKDKAPVEDPARSPTSALSRADKDMIRGLGSRPSTTRTQSQASTDPESACPVC